VSKSWAQGSSKAWRALRRAILRANAAQNRGRCQVQIPGVCTGTAVEVHHVLGKRHGDDPAHLVASCRECNLAIGDPNRKSPPPRPVTDW
jgi:5-methylcytosine-specific restriction endonuclease McrA